MSKGYFSYIRVSTVRQGQTGTSLAEQREAIQHYADRWGLSIVREFEEKETAAKSGRPVFLQMLGALRTQNARGVVIHKIDRSARNLRDWAELGEMIDRGIEVHFVNDNLDLDTRGGRLSADIQAVVAADYIRNLREEVIKGFFGRLKQGFYPMPAPTGYFDKGSAVPKEIDPIQGPLVRKAFELYSTGQYGINSLVDQMFAMGLRNKKAGKVTRNGMAHILHNHFYTGLIKVKTRKELFIGQHMAIVTQELFDSVQRIARHKGAPKIRKHEFRFRRLLDCRYCGIKLIGELQKGVVYYRCHTKGCEQKTIRQEMVDSQVMKCLLNVRFTKEEMAYLRQEARKYYERSIQLRETQRKSHSLQLESATARLSALTDAYLDGVVDKDTYVEKKNNLVIERRRIEERVTSMDNDERSVSGEVEKILELANQASLSYEWASDDEKREMVQCVTSNLEVAGKSVLCKLNSPFQIIAAREVVPDGRPHRAKYRTLSRLLSQLIKYFESRKDKNQEEVFEKPVEITPGRLKLAFGRANSAGPETLAA